MKEDITLIDPTASAILLAIALDPSKSGFVGGIMDVTGLGSGEIYPNLMRLEARGLLSRSEETLEPGDERRPRVLYSLTTEGSIVSNLLKILADCLPARSRG